MADLRQPPAPRYRVVERNRRLVVVDTLSGEPTGRDPASRSSGTARFLPARVRFDGTAELVTRSWYDDHGPRTIRLDPGRAALLRRAPYAAIPMVAGLVLLTVVQPWLLPPLLFALGATRSRRLGRSVSTRWLDRAAQDAG